jgi:acyl-CoA thioesterase-1
MENPCKIVCFGDSITKGWTDGFRNAIASEYPNVEVINEGIISDTTNHALERLGRILDHNPDVVTVGFGMNDWRKDVNKATFTRNLRNILDKLKEMKIRVILMTMNPVNSGNGGSSLTLQYNKVISDVASEKRVRMADVYSLWCRELTRISEGLHDDIHPNNIGNAIIVKSLMRIVPRSNTTVVWQFNGEHAFCNYSCPYCYVSSETNVEHRYSGSQEMWHRAFKDTFGSQRVTFYLSFGEPMASRGFYDVLSMIESESSWEGHMTSNLSLPLNRLVKIGLVRQGRFHINASFHPSQTKIEDFIEKLLLLRASGIETPVIYVMYPPQIQQFETFFREFNKHNFLVHVRRFRGMYKGKWYPRAYTDVERQFIARYCDDATIKYMLNELELDDRGFKGKLTYAGMFYVLVTSDGDVYMCPDHKGKCLGNVIKNDVWLFTEPQPYGGRMDGTVDGIASFLELRYKELEGNHVMSFASQGGVYKESGKVIYKNLSTDFSDKAIRKQYRFPDAITKMRVRLHSLKPWRQ